MEMTAATAPGKIILLGEHAVVYGRPAIAAPVWQVQARAVVEDAPAGSGCRIALPDVGQVVDLSAATGDEQPLAHVARLALAQAGAPADPDWRITLHSDISMAGGLGSGAALSTALVRAIFAHAGREVAPAQVSALVFESERYYHGMPSGIDNSVIAYGLPIWFQRGKATAIAPAARVVLLIADSGIPAPTHETVAAVRRGWEAERELYERRFDTIAKLSSAARVAFEAGDAGALGRLLDENQVVLEQLGVSSAPLQHMIRAARAAGALGAKLSGGGRGGNVIALVEPERVQRVCAALEAAGAVRVIETVIG